MWKFFAKKTLPYIAKKALPFIAGALSLDVDTVQRATGKYYRIRVEAFDYVLLDRYVKASKNVDIRIDGRQAGDEAPLFHETPKILTLPKDTPEEIQEIWDKAMKKHKQKK